MPRQAVIRDLAKALERRLRDGRITLAQVIQLDASERRALRTEAERLRRAGQLGRACELMQLLLGCDPTDVESWRAMAALEQRRGHADRALLCLEAVELLGEPTVDDVTRQRACLAICSARHASFAAATHQRGATR